MRSPAGGAATAPPALHALKSAKTNAAVKRRIHIPQLGGILAQFSLSPKRQVIEILLKIKAAEENDQGRPLAGTRAETAGPAENLATSPWEPLLTH
jgi:hypothetical protein